jgi:hypothetical protein
MRAMEILGWVLVSAGALMVIGFAIAAYISFSD